MESPGAYVDDEFNGAIFCMAPRSFRPPFHASVDCQLKKGEMPLDDAIGINRKSGATTEIKAG